MAKTGAAGAQPENEEWYPIRLGKTWSSKSPDQFYTLRYEFKPASIDTSQPGSLRKGAENDVTVELPNNQAGKPKLRFDGHHELCKDQEGVLVFDGNCFWLHRLHHSVKNLRHVRSEERPHPDGVSVAASDAKANDAQVPGNGSSLPEEQGEHAVPSFSPGSATPSPVVEKIYPLHPSNGQQPKAAVPESKQAGKEERPAVNRKAKAQAQPPEKRKGIPSPTQAPNSPLLSSHEESSPTKVQKLEHVEVEVDGDEGSVEVIYEEETDESGDEDGSADGEHVDVAGDAATAAAGGGGGGGTLGLSAALSQAAASLRSSSDSGSSASGSEGSSGDSGSAGSAEDDDSESDDGDL